MVRRYQALLPAGPHRHRRVHLPAALLPPRPRTHPRRPSLQHPDRRLRQARQPRPRPRILWRVPRGPHRAPGRHHLQHAAGGVSARERRGEKERRREEPLRAEVDAPERRALGPSHGDVADPAGCAREQSAAHGLRAGAPRPLAVPHVPVARLRQAQVLRARRVLLQRPHRRLRPELRRRPGARRRQRDGRLRLHPGHLHHEHPHGGLRAPPRLRRLHGHLRGNPRARPPPRRVHHLLPHLRLRLRRRPRPRRRADPQARLRPRPQAQPRHPQRRHRVLRQEPRRRPQALGLLPPRRRPPGHRGIRGAAPRVRRRGAAGRGAEGGVRDEKGRASREGGRLLGVCEGGGGVQCEGGVLGAEEAVFEPAAGGVRRGDVEGEFSGAAHSAEVLTATINFGRNVST
mmetsp:Transcript_14448/g.36926  ORF Transcript_14448/g.36926 Transcript_14448/m.36926 type:complete len:402 (+) Transcript_14448:233-1438(+)